MVSSSDCVSDPPWSSATLIAGDIDILTEVLIRLPTKPLIRFKSVAKEWFSLISSPHFSRRHARRNHCSASGIFLRRTPSLGNEDADFQFVSLDGNLSAGPFKSLKFANDPQGIKLLQSCNGLLCCCSSRVVDGKNRDYYIYNPTTHQFVKLPRLIDDDCKKILSMRIAFDPRISPFYKVICVRSSADSTRRCYQIEIYSSEIGMWRLSGDPFSADDDLVFDNGVYSNGAIHWLKHKRASLYFDINEEQFKAGPLMQFPVQNQMRKFRYFGSSWGGNHLQYLELANSLTTKFDVFEMKDDLSRWDLKHNVDLNAILNKYPDMIRPYLDAGHHYVAFLILSMIVTRCEANENEEESSLLLHIPGKIILYKLKDNMIKIICDLAQHGHGSGDSKGSLIYGCFEAYPYVESLAFVY